MICDNCKLTCDLRIANWNPAFAKTMGDRVSCFSSQQTSSFHSKLKHAR